MIFLCAYTWYAMFEPSFPDVFVHVIRRNDIDEITVIYEMHFPIFLQFFFVMNGNHSFHNTNAIIYTS